MIYEYTKLKLSKLTAIAVFLCSGSGSFASSPSADDFFNSLYSQAFFLEQCVGNKVISETNIHNHNIKKATSLGFSLDDFWEAGKNGAKGLVFDMIKDKWVRVPLDKTNCSFVEREQNKFNRTLSRY